MQFADLKLPVGGRLQLTFTGRDYKRYPCEAQLLGYRVGETVLVFLPKKPSQVQLYDGIKVEAKVPMQTGIVDFESRIELMCSQPFAYLHLSYPRAVHFEPLRRFPRFTFDGVLALTAASELGITTGRSQGRFCDISLNGAKLALEKELGSTARQVTLSAAVTVAGMAQQLELQGRIQRVFGREDKVPGCPFGYGVAFSAPTPSQRLILLALCQELQTGINPLGYAGA